MAAAWPQFFRVTKSMTTEEARADEPDPQGLQVGSGRLGGWAHGCYGAGVTDEMGPAPARGIRHEGEDGHEDLDEYEDGDQERDHGTLAPYFGTALDAMYHRDHRE